MPGFFKKDLNYNKKTRLIAQSGLNLKETSRLAISWSPNF